MGASNVPLLPRTLQLPLIPAWAEVCWLPSGLVFQGGQLLWAKVPSLSQEDSVALTLHLSLPPASSNPVVLLSLFKKATGQTTSYGQE